MRPLNMADNVLMASSKGHSQDFAIGMISDFAFVTATISDFAFVTGMISDFASAIGMIFGSEDADLGTANAIRGGIGGAQQHITAHCGIFATITSVRISYLTAVLSPGTVPPWTWLRSPGAVFCDLVKPPDAPPEHSGL